MTSGVRARWTSTIEVLLVDAGYREIRTIPLSTDIGLVPPRLRCSPDFFILDLEACQSWHTEIKFRHYLHPALCDDLRPMQREWAPFTLILSVAEPPKEWIGVVRHIKAFTIQPQTKLDMEFFATKGARLQDIFPKLGKRWEEGTIQKAQDAILRITSRAEAPSPHSAR